MSEQEPSYGDLEPGQLITPGRVRWLESKPSDEELRNRFFYHPPKDQAQVERHAKVSELAFALAVELVELCPGGRNLALALTALEDVRMRANAAIACDERDCDDCKVPEA